MIDLSTRYLGLSLANPLVASASPLCESVDNIRAMEDAGAAAVVLHSLFEEQLTIESHVTSSAGVENRFGKACLPTLPVPHWMIR